MRKGAGICENWWVCVFRPEKQFPAVIENTEVTQTVSFIGNGFGNLGDVANWFGAFLTQWLPSAASLSLSIPPEPQKLWEAFHKAMDTRYKDRTIRENEKGLYLGDPDTNVFRMIFNKDTNNPTA